MNLSFAQVQAGGGDPQALPSCACVRTGAPIPFYNTVYLVNRLEAEARAGKPARIADHLSRLDLVILDELGYS